MRFISIKKTPLGEATFPSSTMKNKDKQYVVDTLKEIKKPLVVDKPFEAKEEYTRLKFDPNIRHRPMEMPNHLTYRYLYGMPPEKKAQSAYVAINRKGETWHLFNAERITLGRMAAMIASLIRGKHKPEYTQNRFDLGDKVVVVNAAKVKVTGKKRYQKLYRHYTGYPGGLKEVLMRHQIEKDPCEIIRRAVIGMLPNNDIRDIFMSRNLTIHAEMYHNH